MLSPAALEEAILCLLLFNKEKASTVALKIDNDGIFSNRVNQRLAEVALNYISKFGEAPGATMEYLLEEHFRKGEEGKLLSKTYDILLQQAASIQVEFVVEELDKFLEHRALTTAFVEGMEALQRGEVAEARDVVYKNVAPSLSKVKFEPLFLKNPQHALRFLDRLEQNEFFSMAGIKALDDRGIVPDRKTLTFILASSGKGKSWFLIEMGKAGLQYGKKVLHITLEISGDKTMQRYIQSLFALTKRDVEQIRAPFFIRDSNGRMIIDQQIFQRDPILAKRGEIVRKINAMQNWPDLVIQEFPTATLTTEQLNLYLDSLERDTGFKPDIIIVDYADLMQLNTEQLRVETGKLYRQLRGIAVSRNAAMITASQGNRESEEAKMVNRTNIAEDWSKIGTADCVLTYSQTLAEKQMGLARIFCDKYRDMADRYLVLISQAYSIGQFCLDSTYMDTDLANSIQGMGA